MNLFTLALFYVDKQRAIKRKYRIPEKKLLVFSFAFGGLGAWLGMLLFRHKTRHLLFRISLPAAALITVLTIIFVLNK
ncbi:DUF1294 domain-containing protein [Alkalibacterium putridalgicola]|uniref:DUF1294 domain-containing protein n=1 Tax=Alkalibacterium putridalgicola TaxID=426703 RepID=A0ABQ0UUH7_9LACT|nr:DUF1294 domain-containing protein [Alkalibacterium putridalgicola]GEK88201.1 hypothetical protein APU01nite_02400 [Alkalibacterium putridalgicola]